MISKEIDPNINTDNSNKNFKTRPISDFKEYNFFVDDYQRGYKWTPRQVVELLTDIDEYNPTIKEAFYCLQPLAVKRRLATEESIKHLYAPGTQDIFEVVDGQQRLTTIYLILKVIDVPHYFIRYETRIGSADFLETIDKKLSAIDMNLKIDDSWKEFVNRVENQNSTINNVDNYHFFCAFYTIKVWFAHTDDSKKKEFVEKLKDKTRFIWYEDVTAKESKKIFRDLNSGKIELTQAELIKALFVNSIKANSKEILQLKQSAFAYEWDMIETNLQDDSFWFFISNSGKDTYSTRIDFLFEIIENVNPAKDDKLNIYRIYADRIKNNLSIEWKPIKELFLTLRDWFEDREIYHLIGFMVCRGINPNPRKYKTVIKLIVDENKNIGKKKFRLKLKEYIKAELNRKTQEGKLVYDYETMSYEKLFYNQTVTILLLQNILSYQKSEAKFKFPFDYYKNEKWSLEHIHAQNADDFSKIGEVIAWIKDVKKLKEDLQKQNPEKDLLLELTNALSNLEIKVEAIDREKEISSEISEILKPTANLVKEAFNIHCINNLALLDKNTNSALGNKSYMEKRDKIIEIDKQGWVFVKDVKKKAFIPLCTRNVFLKYYSTTINQMEFWGYVDRKEYVDTIKSDINNYLKYDINED